MAHPFHLLLERLTSVADLETSINQSEKGMLSFDHCCGAVEKMSRQRAPSRRDLYPSMS